MPEPGGDAFVDRATIEPQPGGVVETIERLARTPLLPAHRRLALVEELAGDVEGLALRLESEGIPSADARRRALELLAPSPEAVRELEGLHGVADRPWLPPLLAVGAAALVARILPVGASGTGLLVALATGLTAAGAGELIRRGSSATLDDPARWRRPLRFEVAGVVLVWAATLLAGAWVLHQWLGTLAALPPDGHAVAVATLLHPLVALCGVATAVTLVVGVHLALSVPRASRRMRARDTVEQLVLVLLERSR